MTRIAPCGWTDLADAETFYPADLPADWRPTYFANAFDAVFLPWPDWCKADAEQLADWRADVHAGFRCYLGLPPFAVGPAPADLAARHLGPALAALVEPESDKGGRRRCLAPVEDGWQTAGFAIEAPPRARRDLRTARHWLQDLAAAHGEAPQLVILPRPSSTELADWRQLLLLLGEMAAGCA